MKKNFKDALRFERAAPSDENEIRHQLAMAFGFDRERGEEYVSHTGLEAFRTVRNAAGRLLACAALLPTTHWFGGAAIPAANIAHVAIAPEARGSGLARPLVGALCDDAREDGAMMVSLFASARPVYRKCGFELAGSEIVYEAQTSALPQRTCVEFFEVEPDDERILRAYSRKARRESGLLGRNAVHWKEIFRKPGEALGVYAAGDGANLDAYVVLDASNPEMLDVRDWHAESGDMAEALLCFLGRFRSVYSKLRWHGGPDDELVAAMPDKGWKLAHQEEWLANVLDPVAALERRGYLLREASLGLRLTDAEGDIELHLELADGRMRVSPGAKTASTLVIERPFFSSLFTGFTSASRLQSRGRLSGPTETVQLCDVVFAGPKPWVAEHF
jgi:predicted acetyltransferase